MKLNIDVLMPLKADAETYLALKKYNAPFSDLVMNFVSAFSDAMMKSPKAKRFPDLVSLAFWMRKANILKLKAEFDAKKANKVKVARGLVFHIAPSNVDTIFIYSLFLSLLLGNRNIVRLSSKRTERQEVILEILNDLLTTTYIELSNYCMVVTYAHSDETTAYISAKAKARVIWGGDDTVNTIANIPASSSTLDIKFANKYSYAMLDAQSVKGLVDKEVNSLAENFINDSFWFGQQGCSSPRTVIWLNADGNENEINRFWDQVESALVNFDHDISDADIVNKFLAEQSAMIDLDNVHHVTRTSNLLNVVQIEQMDNKIKYLHCGGGIFFQHFANSYDEVVASFEGNDQTISYFGVDTEKLMSSIQNNPLGIDRVVPVGKALDFYHVWDGYSFMEYLTREITIIK